LELGWTEVQVIDCDLGSSASVGATRRRGFEELIASVALGEVGPHLEKPGGALPEATMITAPSYETEAVQFEVLLSARPRTDPGKVMVLLKIVRKG
ncbi:MAG: hypothetical protein AB1486_33015, partial [Planctomycetota bacterium]